MMRGMKAPICLLVLVALTSGCISTDSEGVTIQRVIDGDTVDIRYDNGTAERVRLIGIDTPEISGQNNPGEFGFSDSRSVRNCLRQKGRSAEDFVSGISDEKIRIVQDSVQRKRGDYGRMLAYVYVGNRSKSLNQILLDKSLARVYYTEFSQRNSFIESERRAKTRSLGVWNCS